MKWIKAIGSLAVTLLLVFLLNQKWGPVPPAGKFLSPFTGFWRNAEPRSMNSEKELVLQGLEDKVTVLFDDNRVPHIFAQNTHDLYYTQGYITARDRLWQMELQTHAAAGRVSEIIGERTLELDRYTRRRGMVQAAETCYQRMIEDPVSKKILEAYSDGINAYISSLTPATYPIEYKLLDYTPEPWKPIKTAFLLKQMATTLATGHDEGRMTNVLETFGYETVKNLFPNYPFRENPVVPAGTKWNFEPVPSPTQPHHFYQLNDSVLTHRPKSKSPTAQRPTQAANLAWNESQAEREVGSNNWAINGSKSATGYPILANDPHLELTLPSIWYQIQLVAPDVNVYGASLPGSPYVISGFNEKVAWGITNVGSDVMDWYKIRFRDASQREYWHDGKWKPVIQRVEVIQVRGKPAVVDTVLYTHHGPVVYNEGMTPFRADIPVGCAMRWIAHEPSNEMTTFHKLNRAATYDDYVTALKSYDCPAQNFVFASVNNDIAIWPNGKFPLKWKEQGKFLLDGTQPLHDWQGWIPQSHNPHVRNPERGFVSSANQFSADTSYPYYLSWEFANYARGERINQRLAAMTHATPDSLRLLQDDNYNILARDVLPQMLSYVSHNQLNDDQMRAYQQVARWNSFNHPDAVGPTIFTLWWEHFSGLLWDEFASTPSKPMRIPNRDRTVQLVRNEPNSPWADIRSTNQKETLADICTRTFRSAIDTLTTKYGTMKPETWAWATYKSTDIPHLSRGIPAFSRNNIWIGGGSSIVNATTATNGPSWRMVVALGVVPKAYGLYPGGQSGNPGSYYYDNMIDTWAKGDLPELVFLRKPDEKNTHIQTHWRLKNK